MGALSAVRPVIRGNAFKYSSANRSFNPLLSCLAITRGGMNCWQSVRNVVLDHPVLAVHHHLAWGDISCKTPRLINGEFLCAEGPACFASLALDSPPFRQRIDMYS